MRRLLWRTSSRLSVQVVALCLMTLGLWRPSPAAEFPCAGGDVACLIEAINAANANGEENTIMLAAGTYTLTAVDNTTDGPNGLASVTSLLTIQGAGAGATIIERQASAPAFRLVHVAATGTLWLEGLTLQGGSAPVAGGGGGGIRNEGTLTLTHSTVSGNSAISPSDGSGGGIRNEGTLTFTHSTVSGNSASGIGAGGIYNSNRGTLMLINSTASGNTAFAGRPCGGIFNTGTLTLTNSTVSGNTASRGGGICNSAGTTVLQNTIVALNTATTGPDCSGSVTSQGYNLIGDPTDCTITLLNTDLTDDPRLGDFTDDGTPGGGYVPLLPNSPAIDAGNDAVCPETDQLGQPRVNAIPSRAGVCDIGAIEFQPPAIEVSIDIKPGSFPNSINPKSKGVVPVAILTTNTLDATTVDPLSVEFGPKGATEAHGRGHIEDVNGDGHLDLVLHFNTQDTGIQCRDTSASLTGETFDGQVIQGSDSIVTVGCK